MKLKKYGAIGMMEWQVDFKVGKATVHVEFKGGFENKFGIHPATFSTKDPIVQSVIERSPFFASGRISLLDTKELGLSAEEIAAEQRKAEQKAKKIAEQKAQEEQKMLAEQSGLGLSKPVDTQLDAQQQENVEEPVEEETDSEGDSGTISGNVGTQSDDAVDEGMKVVKCTCNDDAKQYLIDNFSDIAVRNLRSRDIMIQVGKEHGVLFEFG